MGPVVVSTGKHTARAAADKFVVREQSTEGHIWWGQYNRPFTEENFSSLHSRLAGYLQGRDVFVQDCYAGADPDYQLPVRIIASRAWHALFARTMFLKIRHLESLKRHVPEFTVIAVPPFLASPMIDGTRTDTFIVINFRERIAVIGGSAYAGEIKKTIFTVLNFLLPLQNVLPMHCSANVGAKGDVALFFGLSGTGKTTLSADPERHLIGDDEHGWSDHGVFNFEGGCYAKVIRLSEEAEPQIYATTRTWGTVLENVVMDERGILDLDDDSKTENTRAAYKLEQISNALPEKRAGHPSAVVFLTADAFGILPPLARLTREQAMYWFLSGFTAKLAGTEIGVTEPQPTFSACFGAPFLPQPPAVYAHMLGEKLDHHPHVNVWLVNTGWTGGPFGEGSRMPIKATRRLLNAALGVEVPAEVHGVDSSLLDPRSTWADPEAYDAKARELAQMFVDNFVRFPDVAPAVAAAGPKP
jgi:phosphoenolpyruvate carboxykinase (ATP)